MVEVCGGSAWYPPLFPSRLDAIVASNEMEMELRTLTEQHREVRVVWLTEQHREVRVVWLTEQHREVKLYDTQSRGESCMTSVWVVQIEVRAAWSFCEECISLWSHQRATRLQFIWPSFSHETYKCMWFSKLSLRVNYMFMNKTVLVSICYVANSADSARHFESWLISSHMHASTPCTASLHIVGYSAGLGASHSVGWWPLSLTKLRPLVLRDRALSGSGRSWQRGISGCCSSSRTRRSHL